MSLEALAAVGAVCATLLATVVLCLRFLTKNQLTKTQEQELRAWMAASLVARDTATTELERALNHERERLTQLANRVR